jgi:hypothetical protein
MKRIFTIAAALMMTASVWAQAPEKMSYQAVVRDATNALVTSQAVGMQLSILQGSVTGTSVYVETQTPTTNINGLASIEIGSGTVVSGTFNTIDWSNGPYFIKTETDPTGGTTYTITGTSQLMSVPYALHANTADSIVGGVSITETDPVFGASIANGITALDTANWNNHTVDTDTQLDSTGIANLGYVAGGTSGPSGHYVGELFGGGIVFYVYNNGANGLIASLDDLDGGSGVAWSGNTSNLIGSTAQSFYDGAANTTAMVTQDATANKAGTLCDSYTGGSQTDWYLPASWELNLLLNSAFSINTILENDANVTTNGLNAENVAPTYGRYWSSTENSSDSAWYFRFNFGTSSNNYKTNPWRVRAVRAF